MLKEIIIAVLALAASGVVAIAGDLAAGQDSFRKCMPCHDIGEHAKNRVGPELNGLDGRHSGTAPGYSYSNANKNSGIVWSEATFKEYIKDPKAKIPGTKTPLRQFKETLAERLLKKSVLGDGGNAS